MSIESDQFGIRRVMWVAVEGSATGGGTRHMKIKKVCSVRSGAERGSGRSVDWNASQYAHLIHALEATRIAMGK